MLNRRYLKFKNLSFISIGLALIGFIIALIFVFCVHSEDIDEHLFGGSIAIACLFVAVLCQIVFTNLAVYHNDDEESQAVNDYAIQISTLSVKYFLFLSSVLGLVLPIFLIGLSNADNYHTVLPFVCAFLAILFPLLGYSFHKLYQHIQNKRALLTAEQAQYVAKLKRKYLLPSFVCAFILLTATVVLIYGTSSFHYAKPIVFHSADAFIAYIEQVEEPNDVEKTPYNGGSVSAHGSDGFYWRTTGEWSRLPSTDCLFFWSNESVVGYTLSLKNETLTIKAYERNAYKEGAILKNAVCISLPSLAVIQFSVVRILYTKKRKDIQI